MFKLSGFHECLSNDQGMGNVLQEQNVIVELHLGQTREICKS